MNGRFSRFSLLIVIVTCLTAMAACTGIGKVFSPIQGSPMVEPSFTPITRPLPTNTPEPTNVTPEITPTPNSLQNVEINTEEGPELPIVSQEYLDQESVFASNNHIEKLCLSIQSDVEKKNTWFYRQSLGDFKH